MIRISIPYLITITAAIALLIAGSSLLTGDIIGFQNQTHETARAKVHGVLERVEQSETDFFDSYFDDDEYTDSINDIAEGSDITMEDLDEEYDYSSFFSMVPGKRILFEAKISKGPRKGQVVTAEQTFSPMLIDRSKEVEKGDNILLFNNGVGWYFNGYFRINKILLLGILFAVLLIVFGGKKGFNTILSLGFTCAAIFTVFVPAILSGRNIYVMSLLVCAYTSAMVPLIVMGYNKKSLAAITGCAGGVLIAGLITLIMDKAMHLTGIVDEHSRYLVNLPGDTQIDLKALIFAGIIIGAMGAIMDVSISLSSALWEIKEKAKSIQFKELVRSGFNIGRDIMGTMADTLILAYIGSSLTLVLLLTISSRSLLELFNSEMIAVEVLQALAGSLGILFAMPLTALFCGLIYIKNEKNSSGDSVKQAEI